MPSTRTATYTEYRRRIEACHDIQQASGLLLSLRRFIYGHGLSESRRGPAEWRRTLLGMTSDLVASWRRHPQLHPADYATHLLYLVSHAPHSPLCSGATAEIRRLLRDAIGSYAAGGWESLDNAERMRRIRMRLAVEGRLPSAEVSDTATDMMWTDAMDALAARIDPARLSDDELRQWHDTAEAMTAWPIPLLGAPAATLLRTARRELRRRTPSE